MPTYEYRCRACGKIQERDRSMRDRKKRAKCPGCGSLRSELLISATSFTLEGTGWYQTDYKNPGK